MRYGIILLIGILLLATLTPLSAQTEVAEIQLNDRFERNITERGLTVVDWEGYISNPAIQYTLIPPVDAIYPLTVELSGNHPRLMFDNSVFFDETGPCKTLYFESATPKDFYISIWHDDDGNNESYQLDVNLIGANGAVTLIQFIPIEVIDQDQPERPIEFEITYQFIDQDEGFFDNSETGELRQQIVRRATSDWAYFLADQGFDEVLAGDENIYVWEANGNYESGFFVENEVAYIGFYAVVSTKDVPVPPFTTNDLRSGAQPLGNGWQSRNGAIIVNENNAPLLKRSGTIEFEIKGNYNLSEYVYSLNHDDWWRYIPNLTDPTDFYSVVTHEFGHALAFDHRHYVGLAGASEAGVSTSALLAYYGQPVQSDNVTHFTNAIDPASRMGAFGNDFFYGEGYMWEHRWSITKLDLLLLDAAGYTLRDTSPFMPSTPTLPAEALIVTVGDAFSFAPEVAGGVPAYHWSTGCSYMPAGLSIDSFTGEISGTPTEIGVYLLNLDIDDYDATTLPVDGLIQLVVQSEPPLSEDDLPYYGDALSGDCD